MSPSPKFPLRMLMAASVLGAMSLHAERLAPFYLIEPFLDYGVLLHFDTDAFHRYELQSTTDLAVAGATTARWTPVYTVPSVPFGNHYVVLDARTNAPVKWYRIVVTP